MIFMDVIMFLIIAAPVSSSSSSSNDDDNMIIYISCFSTREFTDGLNYMCHTALQPQQQGRAAPPFHQGSQVQTV